jgi:hypothetical protein
VERKERQTHPLALSQEGVKRSYLSLARRGKILGINILVKCLSFSLLTL